MPKKWWTMEGLAERCEVTLSAISKDLKRRRIAGTLWKGRVFFDEHQAKYAEELYARSPRRGSKQKKKGGDEDGCKQSGREEVR